MPYLIALIVIAALYALWRVLERAFPALFGPGDLTEREARRLKRWRAQRQPPRDIPPLPAIPSEGPWIIDNPHAGEPDR